MTGNILAGFGSGVRARRKRAGLTISQLADLAGVDSGFLAYIETGRKMPSILTAAKIARALDLSLSELFKEVPKGRVGSRYRLQQQLHSLFHDRSPAQAAELLDILRHLDNPKRIKALRQIIRR